MKKVIAAAAGLMLVGAMATSASAAVSFSGDARARAYLQSNYDLGFKEVQDNGTLQRINKKNDFFNSRVRLKIRMEAKGGAYAVTRIRMAEATWDGTRGTRDKGAGSNSYVDYGYIGVPMGPVTLEAGLMEANITKFVYWDNRADMAVLKWANDKTALQAWYQKEQEFTNPDTDKIDDQDVDVWVGAWTQKFEGDWSTTLAGLYKDDQRGSQFGNIDFGDDLSGGLVTLHAAGPIGPVGLEAEISWADENLTRDKDDGSAGYLAGTFDAGPTKITINTGFTSNGFLVDNDFGFIMIGGASSITPAYFDTGGKGIGRQGDTFWVGGIVGYQVSEALSVKGILAYADIDDVGDMWEISGSLGYAISDGAKFSWDIGYLAVSLDNDLLDNVSDKDPFGTAVTFEVKF